MNGHRSFDELTSVRPTPPVIEEAPADLPDTASLPRFTVLFQTAGNSAPRGGGNTAPRGSGSGVALPPSPSATMAAMRASKPEQPPQSLQQPSYDAARPPPLVMMSPIHMRGPRGDGAQGPGFPPSGGAPDSTYKELYAQNPNASVDFGASFRSSGGGGGNDGEPSCGDGDSRGVPGASLQATASAYLSGAGPLSTDAGFARPPGSPGPFVRANVQVRVASKGTGRGNDGGGRCERGALQTSAHGCVWPRSFAVSCCILARRVPSQEPFSGGGAVTFAYAGSPGVEGGGGHQNGGGGNSGSSVFARNTDGGARRPMHPHARFGENHITGDNRVDLIARDLAQPGSPRPSAWSQASDICCRVTPDACSHAPEQVDARHVQVFK